jgi:hypothetical protein
VRGHHFQIRTSMPVIKDGGAGLFFIRAEEEDFWAQEV